MAKYERQLAIRMSEDTYQKLRQRAEREDRPPATMARLMVEKSLLREKIKRTGKKPAGTRTSTKR